MEFTPLDLKTWDRTEYFTHYLSDVPCTYSMGFKLNVSKAKQRPQKLYPLLLHSIATIVNRHEEFRTALNAQGVPGVYDQMHPSYTIFHRDNQTFSSLWTEYTSDLSDFCAAYEQDLSVYGSVHKLEAKPNPPENVFPVSMVPWYSFESFNLNLQKGYDYLIPIFTLGKYYEENGALLMPLSLQVHHSVCDGFHVCRFVEELQALLDADPR